MKVKVKDLKPGMKIMLKQKSVTVSNLRQCPQCHTPNYCEIHNYVYIKWVKNEMFGFLGEHAEVERI
ncbi:MAG: hypothetical protein KAW13_05575 [Dehalococcoidia bacterium]|nr:hypothetical protein [Dehalococcoidia bacterium]